MPAALAVWPVMGSFCFWLLRVVAFRWACWMAACPRRGGRVHGPAGSLLEWPYGVFAGQAGMLAMVMTAVAMRVTVSAGLAWPKGLGDLDLRARCRLRSTTLRCTAISLVTAW